MERDKEKEDRLGLEGWRIMRFWEHELVVIDTVTEKILDAMGRAKNGKL